jgi:hypothetical protein
MREPWGRAVDNGQRKALSSGGLSVDRKAHIVRNPHEGLMNRSLVDNRGENAPLYSPAQLLSAEAVAHVSHNSPVPTGTTGIPEFIKD